VTHILGDGQIETLDTSKIVVDDVNIVTKNEHVPEVDCTIGPSKSEPTLFTKVCHLRGFQQGGLWKLSMHTCSGLITFMRIMEYQKCRLLEYL